ncbi:BaiN/RdsA family NAD(P)/FAD-dependent oxidoreductase [Qiania dongpingensis]|uniref:NAD(P)/FAD-dependent oxidoreductase n=1 Tax=Qiania dongpingensis TaxID=2763669 RepID=A0A7G9G4E9_9FIRM|nr:NAD(P)/FAD-dependent oxidoreductase [Qiania dongpingensis]QNM05681.1 NAD(P)/FAD-dependent oxidoreductase [Qiania dongpingensis]
MKRIIVVGGGAAGMMAAIGAAEKKNQVILLEKNEKLGKKLFITGKGRCNVTNDCDVETLLSHVVTNSKFLYSAFYGFSSRDMKDFLETRGLRLKTERGNRVFPLSDHSSDVIACLERELKRLRVEVRLREAVKEIVMEDAAEEAESGNKDSKRIKGVLTDRGEFCGADAVILATGGLSYASTGSTGDGYRFASAAGHTITELSPALVPFEAEEEWVKELQGLSLRNVSLKISSGKKVLYEEFGEMLFTHYGVSGPAVLSGSSIVTRQIRKVPLLLSIDLKPALSREQLDHRILRDFGEAKNRQFKNSLGSLYPSKLIPVIIKRSGISGDKRVNEISREERETLVSLTKAFTVTLTGLRDYKEAIITQGGVKVREIDPATMESRLVRGLYFAGEMLDLDAVTGGYNLQIAWSTGYAAGQSAGGQDAGCQSERIEQ